MYRHNENSVLTSLTELRDLEQQRRLRDDEARREQEESERQAREAAEARAREEEARARQHAEAERIRSEEERLQQQRDERLRLAEAEQRARIEAEARVEAHRIELELEARRSRPGRGRWIAATLGVAAFAVVGLGYLLGVYLPEQERRSRAAAEARVSEIRRQTDRQSRDLLHRIQQRQETLRKAVMEARRQQFYSAMRKSMEQMSAGATQTKPKNSPRRWVKRPRPVRNGHSGQSDRPEEPRPVTPLTGI